MVSTPPSTSLADSGAWSGQPAIRCLSIDVEEYFHIEAAHSIISRQDWERWPSRAELNIELLLTLLHRHGRPATFFILGDVARRLPTLARRIAQAGHEIASHGTNHDRLHRLNPDTFRRDLSDSKKLLEDQVGQALIGYRAPTFSVVPQTAWAIDVLLELGFRYDASIFPVRHPWYGVPTAPLTPFRVAARAGGPTLLEVPPLVWRVWGRQIAVAGGGYFRLLPLTFMKRGLEQAACETRPAILYFHPWEFDPDMPRMPLSRLGIIRTYTGLKSAAARLESIMRQPATWTTIAQSLPAFEAMASRTPPFALAEAAPAFR